MHAATRPAALALALLLAPLLVWSRPVHLATTAPIEKSRLLTQVLPKLRQATGLEVQMVAATPAQLTELARRGEVDVLLVEDGRPELDKLVASGVLAKPVPLMTTEFLLVGPKSGALPPGGKDVVAAFRKLDAARALFISRGDLSLTHLAEQRYWTRAGMKGGKGGGHRECDCGMGGALDIAATAFGYTLADKATWAGFRNRVDLIALVEGDPQLVLGYSLLTVNPPKPTRERTEAQKAEEAQRVRDVQKFVQWLASAPGQAAIAAHRVGGFPYFFPKPPKK
jgi:tungstate transport system substrate-binding protein